MQLSRPFVLRPVATALLMLAVLIAGLLAWRLLPVAALPQVDFPVIQVHTFQPGASPDVTARTVTAPLERSLGQIPGLQQMSSTSAAGASVITLRFSLDVDLAIAEQDVQAAIQTAVSLLPEDLPSPPIYRKVNPADAPIMTLAVSSDTLPLPQVVDLIDARLAQKLSRLSGVGLVSLAGGQRPAVRVQADLRALASHGLSLEDLRLAITAANTNQPKGSFDGQTRTTLLEANDQIRSIDEFRRLILAWREGAALRLGDVASVERGAEDRYLAAWAGIACPEPPTAAAGRCGQQPAVLLHIRRQPGANVIDVAERVRTLLPQVEATLPVTVKLQVLSDRTDSIRASIRATQLELLFAIGLVVVVTFAFLRTLPATLIPSVAVPLSLVGTFAAMYGLGYSLNNLSLMALTIATGFVVDDAIVMLENIARHREAGEPPLQAALKGAAEIGFTLVSLTVSLVAVLIPLLFMGDVVGRLFHEFAVTLAIAIAISLVVSLTLTPMMAARMLREVPPGAAGHGPDAAHDEMPPGRLIAGYARMLDWVLAHQVLTLLVLGATLVLTALLYVAVPKGFLPVQDSGLIQVVTEAPQGIAFGAMATRQQALGEALLRDPEVRSISSTIGVDGDNATLNSGRMFLELGSHSDRRVALDPLLARLRERAAEVPGIQAWFQPIQELALDDRVGRSQYRLTLSAPDVDLLDTASQTLVQRLRERPELANVSRDLQPRGPQAHVEVDRDAASRLGISVADVAAALNSAFGQRQVSTMFTQSAQYRVVIEANDAAGGGLRALEGLYLTPGASLSGSPATNGSSYGGTGGTTGGNTAAGSSLSSNGSGSTQQRAALVPLSAVARIEQRQAPLAIHHSAQFPAVSIGFDAAPGHSLGAAVTAIEAVQQQVALPAAVELEFQGAADAYRASRSGTLWLVLAAVVVMYLVLGMLYESTIHPLTILSTLPSATVGALLALLVADRPLDLIALVGVVLLIGLVKKNGIMMVDFALDAQRRLGMAPRAAIRRAALLRFRPILMTTLAALFGALPLMLATGSGAELRQPLGIVMVGGLLASQLLTVFTTPVVYLAFDRLEHRRRGPATDAGGRLPNSAGTGQAAGVR